MALFPYLAVLVPTGAGLIVVVALLLLIFCFLIPRHRRNKKLESNIDLSESVDVDAPPDHQYVNFSSVPAPDDNYVDFSSIAEDSVVAPAQVDYIHFSSIAEG